MGRGDGLEARMEGVVVETLTRRPITAGTTGERGGDFRTSDTVSAVVIPPEALAEWLTLVAAIDTAGTRTSP